MELYYVKTVYRYDVTYPRDAPKSFLAKRARVGVLQGKEHNIVRLIRLYCHTFDHSKIQA